MRLSAVIFLVALNLLQEVQAQFTMEGYLSNAVSDTELQFFRERQEFVNENGFKSPILREVEFRARVRTFEEGFGDYRLRFSPLNPFERSANKNYRNELNEQLSISYLLNLEEVLLGRYELMIRHWQLSENLFLVEENISFTEKILELLKSQPSNGTIKDYIRTDKANFKSNLEYETIFIERAALEEQIKQTYDFGGEIQWDNGMLTSVAMIKDWLKQNTAMDVNNNLAIRNEQQKEAVAAAEYKIKQQESFSNIGYVQAEYREDADNSFGQNLGMQIGVSLPVTNPDKPDLQRRKLEMLEDSQEAALEKQNLEVYLNQLYAKLGGLIKQYEMVEGKLVVYNANDINAGSNGSSMDILIEIQEFKTELNGKKIDLMASIYKSYINLLSINSKLSMPPYQNYLSQNKTSFELEETYPSMK
jgi:hypothetical protein